ncbi:PEP-CTERM sorting domain-containing protein [Rhodopirellula sp. P2]|uniref:PEP-CTERM sorting domain-containing protein n=1 Tax=Rhodopirellula sp. P2 TaxID=2127060 RepID=UPI0023678A74|nr:PEP-CTERM sorting domain-containing protein [Rhodopirellula sp. P2]WDQ17604.1 PEP-CTERM sorting domain-containing protein [Rhodopirellula sp. P2]
MQFTAYLTSVALIFVGSVLRSTDAHAALAITIPHVEVAPGGSGHMDVIVSSNGTDSFQNYFLDFVVGGGGQAASPINFVPSVVPAPQITASSPAYIFLDNSLEADTPIGIDFVSDSAGDPIADDFISVTDSTFDFLNRTITSADGNFLLARLNYVAPLNATPGSVYYVDLDFGEFLDSADPAASLDILPTASGTITITAAAVPEPSSMALLAIGSATFLSGRFRRRKKLAVSSNRTCR